MLAFVEHTFGLAPLNPCATVSSWDPACTDDLFGPGATSTYDYMGAFDFTQTPLGRAKALHTPLSAYDKAHVARWAREADQGT